MHNFNIETIQRYSCVRKNTPQQVHIWGGGSYLKCFIKGAINNKRRQNLDN